MQEEVNKLEQEFEQEYQQSNSKEQLEELRVKYLGRKSFLSELFTRLPNLSPQEKSLWGKKLNVLKNKFTTMIDGKKGGQLKDEEKIDLTFPAQELQKGSLHILSSLVSQICLSFEKLGFMVIEGNEIEDEWHNFTALNFPQDHPSKDDYDTFYLNLNSLMKGKALLRCHTSPSQIRVMQDNKPPLAVISPGRVYRPDEVDATHSFMFNQVEGFAVDRGLNFAHLKGVLFSFVHNFFSADLDLRFRPHYFPFTEPSAEVDVSCFICKGNKDVEVKSSPARGQCSVCKGKGWIEILGCGMIHPNVLKFCRINPKKYQGFAFGMGVERIAMLKYGIRDIRLFTENDVRFLRQF